MKKIQLDYISDKELTKLAEKVIDKNNFTQTVFNQFVGLLQFVFKEGYRNGEADMVQQLVKKSKVSQGSGNGSD